MTSPSRPPPPPPRTPFKPELIPNPQPVDSPCTDVPTVDKSLLEKSYTSVEFKLALLQAVNSLKHSTAITENLIQLGHESKLLTYQEYKRLDKAVTVLKVSLKLVKRVAKRPKAQTNRKPQVV